MNDIHKKLKSARISLGLSEKDVCQMTGLTISEYGDLERYSDELFHTLSIAEAKKVCEALKIDLKGLVPRDDVQIINKDDRSKTELISKSRIGLGFTIEQLSDKIGYESAVVEEIESDEKNLERLNVSTSIELARVLKVDPLNFL
jgi:transcriptional regulator with XRE-family HTH domain